MISKGRHLALADFHFHHALIELAFAQLGAEFVAGARDLFAALRFGGGIYFRGHGRRRQQQIEQALFGGLFGALGDFVELFLADHVNRGFHQVADHGFNVAADVADFGVFRGFHFHERAAGQTREAARDFRLAHAGGTDHQNIFRQNVFGEFGREFLAADAIAQGDGHGFFGEVLADDVFVQLDNDFARRELVERGQRLRLGRLRLTAGQIDHHVFLRFFGHSSSTLKLALV